MTIKEERDEAHTRITKAIDMITQYGGFDGGHHKQWVLDQVLRILMPGISYDRWLKNYKGEYDKDEDCFDYEWEEGIPP